MKAERTMPRTHFEAHAPSDDDLADSRKGPRSSSVEGSLPSSLANRYFDCQKTKGAGFKPPREAARSFNSREFCFEIRERESAPAELMPDTTAIYGLCLSLYESAAKN